MTTKQETGGRTRKVTSAKARLDGIERIGKILRRYRNELNDVDDQRKELKAKIDRTESALADAIHERTLPLFDDSTGEILDIDDTVGDE